MQLGSPARPRLECHQSELAPSAWKRRGGGRPPRSKRWVACAARSARSPCRLPHAEAVASLGNPR
eukprot:904106-Alexandrium_andersonii.AAC.1